MTNEPHPTRVNLGPACFLTNHLTPPVVAITGEVDVSNAARLRSALFDIVHTRPPVVVLDIAELTFLDACGLGALLEIHHWLCDGGSQGLAVRNPTPIVRRLLQITGHDSLLERRTVVMVGG